MRKAAKVLLSAALCLPLLHGCTPARTKIVYSIYPVGWLLNTISGNTLATESIQDDTVPLPVERAQLKTDYRDVLKSAKAFFHIGNLEPYLSVMGTAVSESGADDEDLSSLNAVYEFARYTQTLKDGSIKFTESSYYEGNQFNSIDTLSKDLSLWNDPIAMLGMAGNIRTWLKTNDPSNAETYEENYEKLNQELINLDAKYQSFALSLSQKGQMISFVSMTASFGNWQKTYGIGVYPLILSRYGVLPTEAQLQGIETRIRKDGVKYIVYESNMSEDMTALFERVKSDCSLTRIDLSNLSALSQEQISEGKDYVSIMYENLAQLETMTPADIPTAQ